MAVLRRNSRSGGMTSSSTDALPFGVVEIHQYVGEMSLELAKMARAGGDEQLACLLEVAGERAKRNTLAA